MEEPHFKFKVFVCFRGTSCIATQAGLTLPDSNDLPAAASQESGATGACPMPGLTFYLTLASKASIPKGYYY